MSKKLRVVVEGFLTAVCKNTPATDGFAGRPRPRRGTVRGKLQLAAMLFLLSLSLLTSGYAGSPTSDDCLACHSDKTLTTKRGGRTVSLFVDQKKFAGSIHGSLQCTNCHAD
jgi:hypothetical protein